MVLSSEQFERIVGQVETDPAQDQAERVMLPDGSYTVNRRKETRIPFGQRAKIHLKQDENAGHWSTVMLQDISLQGISFLSDEPLEVGDVFSLCLKEQSGTLVTIESTVQRCEPGGFGGTSFSIAGKFQQILQNVIEQNSSSSDSSNHTVTDPFEAYGGGDATTGNSVQKKQRGNLASALNPFRLWSHLTKEYDDFSSGSSGSGSKLTDEALAQIAKTMEQGVSKGAAPSQATMPSHAPSGGRRSSIFIHEEPASNAATNTSPARATAPVATTSIAAVQPELKQEPAVPAPVIAAVAIAAEQPAPAPAQTPTPVVEALSAPEEKFAAQAEPAPAPNVAPASQDAAAQAPTIVTPEPAATVVPVPAPAIAPVSEDATTQAPTPATPEPEVMAGPATPVSADQVAAEPAAITPAPQMAAEPVPPAPSPEVAAPTVAAAAPQVFVASVVPAPQVVAEPIAAVVQPQGSAAGTTPTSPFFVERIAPPPVPQEVVAVEATAAPVQIAQEPLGPVISEPVPAHVSTSSLPQPAEEAVAPQGVVEPVAPVPAPEAIKESPAPVVVAEVSVEPTAPATRQVVEEPPTPAPAPEIAEAIVPAPEPQVVAEQAAPAPTPEVVGEPIASAAPQVVTAQAAAPQTPSEPIVPAAPVAEVPVIPVPVPQVVAEPVTPLVALPVAEPQAAPLAPKVAAVPQPAPQPTVTQPAAEKKTEVEKVSSQATPIPASAPAPEEIDYAHWARRSLVGKRYVYMWAGELAIGQQPNDTRILVLLGAPENGKCELIALHAPIAATPAAWKQLLVNLMRRGLTKPPKLAIADRKLGFWPALADFSPATRKQFSWDNQIAHLLGLLPKGLRRLAERELRQAAAISNKEEAIKAIDLLIQDFQADAAGAAECLEHEKEFLFTFHDFPAEHAAVLRSAAQIQSLFRGAEPLLREDAIRMETKLNALLNLAQRGEEIAKKAA